MQIKSNEIKLVALDDIKLNNLNSNRHPPEQIDRLAELIKYQGFRVPGIISNRSGVLIAGEGKYLAAKKLGMTQMPIIYQDFDSDEQETAFGISDNAIAAWANLDLSFINTHLPDLGPDFDIDLLGIRDFTLDLAEKLDPQCDEDEVPESLPEPKVVRGEVYILGNHRLMCGDSTMIDDVEKLMTSDKSSLLFTSPPYADQREYNGNKELSLEKITDFIPTFYSFTNLQIINLGYSRKENQVDCYWDEYIKKAKESGLMFLSWNIWNRSGYAYTVGQATAMFTIDHEWIFVFGKSKIELNKTVENKQSGISKKGTIRQKSGKTDPVFTTTANMRQMGTVYTGDVARFIGEDHKHPAMFPVHLPESYILSCTQENEIVCDPFTGSGTTMIACENTNRRFFGMELDPHYCGVILDRWQKYTGKKAHREDGVLWDDIRHSDAAEKSVV